ncbi:unnamed protein product [Rhizophagus irregularis]|nr:unnamed protein product [Rhizophagus irregularis]
MYSWKRGSTQYQEYVSIFHINSTAEEEYNKTDDRVIYIEDLEKREEIYGTCWECKEPGTGEFWCQSCNGKRFKENFKNWTSGNKDIDELIQDSQLNARRVCLDDSIDTNLDLLNEIKSYLHMYTWDIIQYFGITQDPNSKDCWETHPQAIYTSRLLSFKNLPEPVNSNDLVSECFDCVIDETA